MTAPAGSAVDEARMPMLGHLEELRSRLIKVAWTLLAACVAAYFFSDILIGWLKRPLKGELYFFSPTEAFWVTMKVSFVCGFFLSIPVLLYQGWRFISPGLHLDERRLVLPYVLLGSCFFALGLVFCYFVVFPAALHFLVNFGIERGLSSMFSIGLFMDFQLKLLLAFGIIFELPLVITLLARIGLMTPDFLARQRPYAVLLNAIVAAILTPTSDLFNMMLMMVPLLVFYEMGILGARLFGRKPASKG